MKATQDNAFRAVILSAVSEGSSALLFLFGILIARAIGPSDYGIFAYALALAGVFALFLDGGLARFLARQGGRHPRRGYLAARSAVTLQIILFPILAAGFLVAYSYFAPEFVPLDVAVLAGVATAARAIKNTLRGLFQARARFGTEALLMLAERVALVGLGVAALFQSMSVQQIMAWFCGIKLADLAVSLIVANNIAGPLKPCFRLRWLKWITASIAPFFATMALVMSYNYFDVLMLGHFRNEGEVGVYAAIYVFFAGLVLVPSAFSNAFLPRMSKAHDEGRDGVKKSADSALRILFVLSAPVVTVTWFAAEELLQIAFGDEYLSGALGFRVLLSSAPSVFLFWFMRATLIAVGRVRSLLRITAVGLVTNILLNLMLIPRFGLEGACVATLVAEAVLLGQASQMVAHQGVQVIGRQAIVGFFVVGSCVAIGMLFGKFLTGWWILGFPVGIILAHLGLCRGKFWSAEELNLLRRRGLAW
jgi:O-antigen/teichoic acid export membrane protein